MKKSLALLSLAPALALAATAANAAVVPVGTSPNANPFFYTTSVAPGGTTATAIFGDTVTGASSAFDDSYTFTLPLSGYGSGSVSTSFAGLSTQLTISSVIINGVSYSVTEANAGISDVKIVGGVLNTIEIIGTTGPSASFGTYDGTATFEASAVPEPLTWITFLMGFGFMGLAMRRKFIARPKMA